MWTGIARVMERKTRDRDAHLGHRRYSITVTAYTYTYYSNQYFKDTHPLAARMVYPNNTSNTIRPAPFEWGVTP